MTIKSSMRKFRVIIRFHHFQCYIYTLSYIQDMFFVTHTAVFFCSNVEKETNTCICWYLKLCRWNNDNSNTNKMFSYLKKNLIDHSYHLHQMHLCTLLWMCIITFAAQFRTSCSVKHSDKNSPRVNVFNVSE